MAEQSLARDASELSVSSDLQQRLTDARSRVNELVTRVGAMKRCGDESSRLVGQAEREAHVHVALDGKTLRETVGHEAADQRKLMHLALYETGTSLVLKEQVVGDKQKELSIAAPFLTPV